MRKKLIGFIALLSSLVLCAGCFGSGNDSSSNSSSNSIETEQSGNGSSDITDDSSSDDSSSDDSSSDDSSSDDSSSDDSSSDDSSSDDSSSDDSSSDDSSSDDSSSDDIVDDNKYAIGTEIYTGATMTKDGDTITYTAEELGAQVFEGLELAQGTNYVIYATIASGMTAENVGFVVGTLGEDNSQHLLFQWRTKKNDFYVWKNLGDWAGHNDNIFNSSIGTEGAEIALVYKNGTYYAFLNGEKVCYFNDSFDNGWGGMMDTKDVIGKEGTIKLGLSIAYGTAQFTEYGYSTDAEVINGYVADEPVTPPVVEPVEPSYSEYAEVENFACNISGDYKEFTMGAEATNYNPHFEAVATFNGGDATGKIGFELTAEDGKVLQFVYNKEANRFGFYNGAEGASDYREYDLNNNLFNATGANTIKVIYNGNRTFEVWMNGEKVLHNTTDTRFQDRFTMGWNCGAYDHSQGSGYPFEFWGTSTINDRATLKVRAYASDGSTITDFVCETTGGYKETPVVPDNSYSLGTELYTGATMTKDGDTITYTATGVLGAQVFEGVELAQDTNYVIYATVASGMTAQNVGFVVGTLGEDNSKHLLFQWRKGQGDFYVWKDLGGWAGHNDNIFKSSIGTEGAEVALVYKNGTYYVFLNGEKVCYFGNSFDNGWGGSLKVADTIGAEGTIKIGLSVAYGTAQFTEYGYSTDAEVINGYVADEPVTPPAEPAEAFYADIENFACDLRDQAGHDFMGTMGHEAGPNPSFEISATFDGGSATGTVGFELSAQEGKVLRFVYNKATNCLRVENGASGATGYAEYSLANDTDKLFNHSGENTITIKYLGNRHIYIYINGTELQYNYGSRYGYLCLVKSFYCEHDAYKDEGGLWMSDMWGTSTVHNPATLRVSAYASDADTEIKNFTCTTPVQTESN